jgi:DNA polymerase delta subunit 1
VSPGQQVIERVEIAMRENLWGYNGGQKSPFLKIFVREPRNVPKVRSVFEAGEVSFLDMFQGSTLTFESNIQFVLRFMIDNKVLCLRLC